MLESNTFLGAAFRGHKLSIECRNLEDSAEAGIAPVMFASQASGLGDRNIVRATCYALEFLAPAYDGDFSLGLAVWCPPGVREGVGFDGLYEPSRLGVRLRLLTLTLRRLGVGLMIE